LNKKSYLIILILILIPILFTGGVFSCGIYRGSESFSQEEVENGENVSEIEAMEEEKESEIAEEEIIPVKIWINEEIPQDFVLEIRGQLSKNRDGFQIVAEKEDSDARVEVSKDYSNSIGDFVLVPVVSFFRTSDDISYVDFIRFWSGEEGALSCLSSNSSEPELVLTDSIYGILVKILGESSNSNIRLVEENELLININNDNVFSIIPFDDIEKKCKVLNLDNTSVFDKELDIENYPLAVSISIGSNDPGIKSRVSEYFKECALTNRNTGNMASVIMTGVTAMVRGTANRMERYGILYPGEKIAEILRNADITHISNEVPFVENCDVLIDRFPIFCSKPSYIELLEFVGTDVVELTGNHMNDYGHDWFLYTLDMYDEEGWQYYGGGRNLEESYRPAVFESNGNKFAFLGFNWWGPEYDWANAESPGSAPPNFEDFEEIIKTLKDQGYIVIFTFQYLESYQYSPTAQQIEDFRRMIDAGASIVSGSQSHFPMGFEFRGDGFISYGLGNLFFDQMYSMGTRQGIIEKHIFYDGEHINTILITTMLEDYSQPRPTTSEERVELLNSVFNGSIR
jgi:hypothetical protein